MMRTPASSSRADPITRWKWRDCSTGGLVAVRLLVIRNCSETSSRFLTERATPLGSCLASGSEGDGSGPLSEDEDFPGTTH
jgi:hypothetical protein